MFRTAIVPQLFSGVSINGFAFDTGVVVRAFSQGLRVKEVPINWTHGRSSKVKILREVFSMGSDILSLWYYHHLLWRQNKVTYPSKKGSILAHLLFAVLSLGLKQKQNQWISEMSISEVAEVEANTKGKVEAKLAENEMKRNEKSKELTRRVGPNRSLQPYQHLSEK